MQRQRLFDPGPWAPAWAILAACAIAGSVLGTAYVIQELPGAVDDASQVAKGALRDASHTVIAAQR